MMSEMTVMSSAPRSAKRNKAMAAAARSMADAVEVFDEAEESNIEPPRATEPPPPPPIGEKGEETTEEPIQIRENLNETVFFYPDLMTDAEGNIIVKFKMNEALTRWKFLGIATVPPHPEVGHMLKVCNHDVLERPKNAFCHLVPNRCTKQLE